MGTPIVNPDAENLPPDIYLADFFDADDEPFIDEPEMPDDLNLESGAPLFD